MTSEKTADQPNVRIFATHTVGSNNHVLRNGVFEAVRGGAFREQTHTLQPDCEGENISEKNPCYCELTTQYWAWKNVDADYYGFIHYRRMLSFADREFGADAWGNVKFDYLTDRALREIGVLDEDRVRRIVSEYDVLTPTPVDLKKVGIKSVYEQYEIAPKLHIEDLDLMLEIIRERTPDYYAAASKYLAGSTCYLCNVFVLKKELFRAYCEFLFTVLEEFDRRKDTSEYSVEAYRTQGHLGERMFGIFLTHLKEKGGFRIGAREMVYFSHTQIQPRFQPAFSENNIPVIFACNEYYAQFCSSAILSLAEHASPENHYDLIVLGKDFSATAKSRLQATVADFPNVSVRFYDVGALFDQYHLFERPNISMETYYRLVIPEVFDVYDKVLYLDGDLIVLDDVAKLYAVDIGDCYLGAARDIGHQGNLNGGDRKMMKYYKQFGCKDCKNFFNAGVLIMNTKQFRADFTSRFLLDLAQQGAFMFQDQDLLNILCEGRIYDVGYEWNFYGDPVESYRGWFNSFAPHEAYQKYMAAKKNFHIIHYAGNEKPWWNPAQEYAEIFWRYFRKTPYYEAFLTQRMRDYASDIAGRAVPRKKEQTEEQRRRGKFGRLLPKGTRRREIVKKIVCFFTRKPYIEPDYEAEGITPKYKTNKG